MDNSIANNYNFINKQIEGSQAKIIAVTKTKPISVLQEAYSVNIKRFGENKVQEMCEKYEQLPKDIEWHLIGHLQTNKVKYMAHFVDSIHSVDSIKLLEEINKQAQKHYRIINCLLQIYIAQEDTKFGLSQAEALEILENAALKHFKNIKIVGLMGMASNIENTVQIRNEFKNLKLFFDKLKSTYISENVDFQQLSMGMSGDFEIAAQEGATWLRIGSLLFGQR